MPPHAFTCLFRALKETLFRVGTGMADVQFIGSPESQQIPLNQLRPCQPSQTDPSMQYNDREAVEVTNFSCVGLRQTI